jgi:hypothetical protein
MLFFKIYRHETLNCNSPLAYERNAKYTHTHAYEIRKYEMNHILLLISLLYITITVVPFVVVAWKNCLNKNKNGMLEILMQNDSIYVHNYN